jgi:hypothetical protein
MTFCPIPWVALEAEDDLGWFLFLYLEAQLSVTDLLYTYLKAKVEHYIIWADDTLFRFLKNSNNSQTLSVPL